MLREARRRLAAAPFEPSPREAILLLARVLGRSEASVLAHPEEIAPAATQTHFCELLERRLAGEPVAYLFGEREFYGRPFAVDSRVLIPRPETEHLIEAALALELPPRPRILDVGTGSGILAVTLALEIPEARLLATDVSLPALQVARSNVRHHGVRDRVTLVNADLISAIDLRNIDLVVSNPPYIDPEVAPELSPEVTRFEPELALFAADRGRATIEQLLQGATGLRKGGYLLIEIGHDQGEWLSNRVERPSIRRQPLEPQNAWRLIEIVRDYSGFPRTAVLVSSDSTSRGRRPR